MPILAILFQGVKPSKPRGFVIGTKGVSFGMQGD